MSKQYYLFIIPQCSQKLIKILSTSNILIKILSTNNILVKNNDLVNCILSLNIIVDNFNASFIIVLHISLLNNLQLFYTKVLTYQE